MSYYQGDYYRGDYYRGDPGFFSVLGGLAKSAVGLIPGVGPIASKALSVIPTGGTIAARAGSMVRKGGAIALKHPVLTGAAAAGTIGALGAGAGRRMAARRGAAMMMPGMRRRRRMRVTNPKALRRAIRRAEGFSKLARRVLHFTHPKLARGRPHFRIKRRKRVV